MRKWRRLALVVLVVAVLLAGWHIYTLIMAADQAERVLHATQLVTLVAEKYVQDYGKWPTSWDDLERIPFPDRAMYRWPGDSERVKALVHVDFGVSLEQLAKNSPRGFQAIKPLKPTFDTYDLYFDSLLATIRHSARKALSNNKLPLSRAS